MTKPQQFHFPLLRSIGDAGLMIEFGDCVDPAINRQAVLFEKRVRSAGIEGVQETVSTIKSVVLKYDPLVVPFDLLSKTVHALLEEGADSDHDCEPESRTWVVPVCYDEEMSPDLKQMAGALKLTTAEVVRLHTATKQHVFMIGFAPGFLYSGLLPNALHLPRRTTITPEIPLGAIICAVGQTCIAATVMPTGWYEIGRTPVRNFLPGADPAVLIKSGDSISFTAVSKVEYDSLDAARDRGAWQPKQCRA